MPIQRPGICGHVQWCHVVSEGLVPTVCTRATIPRKTNIIHIRLMMVYIFATYMFVSCSCCWRGQLNKSWQFQWIFASQKAKVTHNLQQLKAVHDVYKEKDVFWNVVLFNALVSAQNSPSSHEEKGSGVTSLNPLAIAPEAWSDQWNCRAAFIAEAKKRYFNNLLCRSKLWYLCELGGSGHETVNWVGLGMRLWTGWVWAWAYSWVWASSQNAFELVIDHLLFCQIGICKGTFINHLLWKQTRKV